MGKMAKLEWHTEKRKVSDLILFDGNPRQMSEKQADDLLKSLKKFNLVEIPVIDTTNRVLAGNMRVTSLHVLGRENEEIEVRVPNRELTEKEAREYLLRSNKNTGGWDTDLLANFDEDMLIDCGWDSVELDKIFELDPQPEDDEVPAVKQETDTKAGDLFVLGRHRLLCGDSTNREDTAKLMGEERADMGFTSPPYWVGKEYEKQKSVEEIEAFIIEICGNYSFAVKKDYSRIVINTSTGFTTSFDKKNKRQTMLLIDKWVNAFYSLSWNLRHIRHWIKEGQLVGTAPNLDMLDQHCEFLGTFENDKGEEKIFDDILPEDEVCVLETFYNKKGKSLGQNRVGKKWALRSYWNDIKGNANQTGHCAAFPVELAIRHLLLYTQRDNIVLDLFLGSGSTLIASQKLSRICYGMEIDPLYCDVICSRYCKYVGSNKIFKNGEEVVWNKG